MSQQDDDNKILKAEQELEKFLMKEFPDAEQQGIWNYVDEIAPAFLDKGLERVIKELSDFENHKKHFIEYRKIKGI